MNAPLPNPCDKCAPYMGLWQMLPAGLERCDCARGIALSKADRDRRKPPEAVQPIISPGNATMYVEMLSAIPFFEKSAGARGIIADELAAMVHSDEMAVWLVRRMVRLFDKWPGVAEMRRVLCASTRPLDGVEPTGISAAYPEGYPSERPAKQEYAALGSGSVKQISGSPSITNTVEDLAEAKDIEYTGKLFLDGREVREVRDIPILPPGNRVTQAQIDEAVQKSREERDAVAKKEAGL